MNAAALWLLVVTANAAPLLGRRLGHPTPLDLGLRLSDGRRLLGDHKSWRGVCLSIVSTVAMAWLLELPLGTGIAISLWAMMGDMLASLAKRRFGIDPGRIAPGLDQLPESALPLIMVGRPELAWTTIAALSLAFMAFDIAVRLIYSRIRQRS